MMHWLDLNTILSPHVIECDNMASDEQAERTADLVTQIQQQINRLCFLFFNDVGSLQRDAPPASIRGEPVANSNGSNNYDVDKQVSEMADQLAQSVPPLLALIDRVPDTTQTENEAIAEIATLQQQAHELDTQLREALKSAETQLQDAHAVYSLLAQHQLRQRQPPDGNVQE